MRIRLTVISDHRQDLGDRAQHVFTEEGGVIGRNARCDWALPDDSKTLSSRHATIGFVDGVFTITDTSTNGVYLNSVDAPLGGGVTTPLRAGDTLYLGPYALGVEPIADALDGRQRLGLGDGWKAVRGGGPTAAPPSSGDEIESLVAARRSTPAADPLAGFAPMPAAPAVRPAAPTAVDPLAGLAEAATDGFPAGDLGRSAEDDLLAPPSPRAPLPGPARPPVPPGAAHIPTSFDPAGRRQPPAPGPIPTSFLLPDPLPAREPTPGRSSAPAPMPLPLPAAREMPSPPPPPPAPARDAALPTDVMALLRLRALAGGTPVEATAPPRREPADTDGRLLSAIGVDPAALAPREQAEAAEALAAFVLEAADGLVAVLEARRSVKDELRLDHTRLGPVHNNPFKFFATGREAVRQIVERRPAGFDSLAAGAREGFDDIKAHELATMAAVHAVATALVARLSPAAIESATDAGGLFGRADKAKLWERYVDQHGRIAETLDVAVNELISREFARAYRRHADDREEQGR